LALLRRLVSLERPFRIAYRALGVFTIWRVSLAPKRLKAGFIVGIFSHELHKRVFGLRRIGSDWVLSVYWWHRSISFVATIITYKSSTVKGYLPG